VELKLLLTRRTASTNISLNRTRVELKPPGPKSDVASTVWFESNQSGIETHNQHKLAAARAGLNRTRVELKPDGCRTGPCIRLEFESNQSGIETLLLIEQFLEPMGLNRTRVELKRQTRGVSWLAPFV